jgi:hypothetical protein
MFLLRLNKEFAAAISPRMSLMVKLAFPLGALKRGPNFIAK